MSNQSTNRMEAIKKCLCLTMVCALVLGAEARNTKYIKGCVATYAGAPRLKNGRVDLDRLLAELTEIQVNTYNWLIFSQATDWDDLKLFLPKARKKKIHVWVTLVPPSESKPHSPGYSEPFRLDYGRWAVEIARLSVQEKNLVAWSMDDFAYDLATFTPEATRKMLEDAHAINPRLAFVPCCYFGQLKPKFLAAYSQYFDGILFPYRDESSHKANTTNAEHVASEMAILRQRIDPSMPIIVDVYATKHSQHPVSNARYVEEVMQAGRKSAEGVMIYRHQDPAIDPEKYAVVKKVFTGWGEKRSIFSAWKKRRQAE